MRVATPVLRALPLTALFAFAAVTAGCNIVIGGNDGANEGEGETQCPDLGAICPSLSCENGNVLAADGCAICECNGEPACDLDEAGPGPECANAQLDPQTCQWSCEQECSDDAECGRGSVCVFTGCADGGAAPGRPDDGAAEDPIACESQGFCQQIATECFSDAECGAGFHCSFDGAVDGGAGGNEPAPAPPDDAGDVIAPSGLCVQDEVVVCFFVDGECGEGRHCEPAPAAPGGLVIAGGVCVDDAACTEGGGECGAGASCVITCESDPGCPNCDICLVVAKCVPDSVACSSDLDCGRAQVCSFDANGGVAERPCFDENGDGVCDGGDIAPPAGVCVDRACTSDADCGVDQVCSFGSGERALPPVECVDQNGDNLCDEPVAPPPPAEGVCVAVSASCNADVDCGAGQVCQLNNTDGCICDRSCIDDGAGGCLPCDCPAAGTCVDAATPSCSTDADCAAGQQCQFNDGCACPAVCIDDGMGGCLPCDCPAPQGSCVDVQQAECADSSTCAEGQVCEFGPEGCENPCEIIDGQQVCHPCDPILVGRCVTPTTDPACFADTDCAAEEQCVFADGFAPPPPPPECTDPNNCPARPAPAPQGTCQPISQDPCALVRCESGVCEVAADGTAVCVTPEPTTPCASANDCAAGDQCNAGIERCDANPSCVPDQPCTQECWGICVTPAAG